MRGKAGNELNASPLYRHYPKAFDYVLSLKNIDRKKYFPRLTVKSLEADP